MGDLINMTKYYDDRYLDDEGFFVSYHPYAEIAVIGKDFDAIEKRKKKKVYVKTFECEFCRRELGRLVNKKGRTTGYYCVYCNITTSTRDAKNLREIIDEREE
jgi:hypothetical protein